MMRVRNVQRRWVFAATIVAAMVGSRTASLADESVVFSKHDLSASGPGTVRAANEEQVCIFCHAPHNAAPQTPLWNRHNPTSYYRIYSSSTTDARIDQPGGSSKMCLSCHDGSIAMGLVLSRSPTEPIVLNQPFMPTGPSNLTNDLSDDHPIGLRFDRQLSNRDPQLRSPDLVSREVKLGPRGELECVACHDPHNDERGDFLRITTREGALCNTCHQMDGWRQSAHAISGHAVPVSVTNGQALPFGSMSQAACGACHVAHGAPHRERLLRARSFELCIGCHNGASARDITSVLNQRSGHSVQRFFDLHDPAEEPGRMPQHVDCVDCHNPHAVRQNSLSSAVNLLAWNPFTPGPMEKVDGVSQNGTKTEAARFYHEVCFKCHGDYPVTVRGRVLRQRDVLGNIRREILPTAASSHPILLPGRHTSEVPSLLPELRTPRTISCQECHNNPEARQLGGGGPNGPHGSRFEHLLVARYETGDFTMESPQSYALCYRCHDRASILNDESFPLHRRHIVDARSPCSACHAPHGVSGPRSQHSSLINFDISIVGGRRLFNDTGRFAGSCTLSCHNVNHVNFVFGP